MEERITLDMLAEELAAAFPEAVSFLLKRGVRCIRCGEPVWGSLGELLKDEGVEDPQALLDALNDYIRK